MNINDLQYRLTETEREMFEQDGYFIVEDALQPEVVAALNDAVDKVDAQDRHKKGNSSLCQARDRSLF